MKNHCCFIEENWRKHGLSPTPPAQIRACMATQQPVIHMSHYPPYPTGLFPWPNLLQMLNPTLRIPSLPCS